MTSQTAVLDELENLGIKATSTNTYENTDAPLLTLTDLFSNIENLVANGGNKAPKWSEVVAYLESGNKLVVSNPTTEGDSSASVDFDESKLFNVEFIVTEPTTGNKTAYTTASTYTSPVNRYQGITCLLNVKS